MLNSESRPVLGNKDVSVESPKTTAEMTQVVAGTHHRPVWSSQWVYIVASIAGVVGLGNIWRFPYMVGQN